MLQQLFRAFMQNTRFVSWGVTATAEPEFQRYSRLRNSSRRAVIYFGLYVDCKVGLSAHPRTNTQQTKASLVSARVAPLLHFDMSPMQWKDIGRSVEDEGNTGEGPEYQLNVTGCV